MSSCASRNRTTRACTIFGAVLLCLSFSVFAQGSEPSSSVAEQALWNAVAVVNDPELDIGIVDLGLVRRIVVNETPADNEPHVILTMVLTSPLCPYAKDLLRGIRDAVQTTMPEKRLKVVIDGKTRWTPAMMTEEGKRRFAGGS